MNFKISPKPGTVSVGQMGIYKFSTFSIQISEDFNLIGFPECCAA
jgi:hypothetical protein